jgi:hypothetical protein
LSDYTSRFKLDENIRVSAIDEGNGRLYNHVKGIWRIMQLEYLKNRQFSRTEFRILLVINAVILYWAGSLVLR